MSIYGPRNGRIPKRPDLCVKLGDPLYKAVAQHARAEGRSMSDWVRRIVEAHVEASIPTGHLR